MQLSAAVAKIIVVAAKIVSELRNCKEQGIITIIAIITIVKAIIVW